MEETVAALRNALATAVRTPRLSLEEEPEAPASPLCVRVAGFTLHAAQWVAAEERAGLQREDLEARRARLELPAIDREMLASLADESRR